MPDNGSWILVGLGALLAGGTLGILFFGGLWLTVRRGASSPTPARWFIGSLVLRTTLVLAGFYAVGAGQPLRLGLCLLGFLLARTLVLRATAWRATRTGPLALEPAAIRTPAKPPCA